MLFINITMWLVRLISFLYLLPNLFRDALSIITYGPSEDQPIFANNGCKRFVKHIPYVIQKYKPKDEL